MAKLTNVAILSATGAQNRFLNVGDVLTLMVSFDDAIFVSGTPQLSLQIGDSVVQANYTKGSGSRYLTFTYTIEDGLNDTNGISIAANSLCPNSGSIVSRTGATVDLSHAAVADNAYYKVDTIAPVATLTEANLTNLAFATMRSSEAGLAYLVKTGAGGVNIQSLADITSAADSQWNSIGIAANIDTRFSLAGLEDGTYTLYTVDAAGNLSSNSSQHVTIGTSTTAISRVLVSSATGAQNRTLNTGDELTIIVSFDGAVNVTGTPQLALQIGNTTVQANYVKGSGSKNLTFTYTIANGLTDDDGVSIAANSLHLNDGRIVDTAGNAVRLDHASIADNAYYKVDTTAPIATLTAANLADKAFATVRSTETGIAYMVKTGTDGVNVQSLADITSAADSQWNSIGITPNIDTRFSLAGLEDGDYTLYTVDAAGNLSRGSSQHVTVDSTAPTITRVLVSSATGAQNKTLNSGDVLTVIVSFNEAVTVTGTPQLALQMGDTTTQANYVSGSGSKNLIFTYTIENGLSDTDGISIAANSLLPNGGSITDVAGNAANLDHAALADNTNYKVDTVAPVATLTSAALSNQETATVHSSENGIAYLVKTSAGGVNVQSLADILNAADSQWSSIGVTQDTDTRFSLTGLEDGTYTLYVVDAAGNLSQPSSNRITVGPVLPSAPIIALSEDSGNHTDSITNNGLINVSGLADGASWEYSTDDGYTWQAGSGSSVALNGDGEKSITVRQIDTAGHTGNTAYLAFTLDTAAPTATLTRGTYDQAHGTLVLTGSHFDTLGVANGTDIKAQLDWSKLVWDINGDNNITTNQTFALVDIASATVTSATSLTITLTTEAQASLEGMASFGTAGNADKLDVASGFIHDLADNAASTDALLNGVIAASDPALTNTSVTVHDTLSLRSAINNAQPGTTIYIAPGEYDTINISGKQHLTLLAADPDNKPHIQRVNMYDTHYIEMDNIVFGASQFDPQINVAIGINASYSDNLLFVGDEVRNTLDAIGIRHSSNVEILQSYIHDNQRDGINMLDVDNITISDNIFTSFHPNYENYNYQDWYFSSNGTAYLDAALTTPADHADFIQLTDSNNITIAGNTLDATGGAWTQSIFITDGIHYAPVTIDDNLIANGHRYGIKVVGQYNVEQNNNVLTHITTNGITGLPADFSPGIEIATYDPTPEQLTLMGIVNYGDIG